MLNMKGGSVLVILIAVVAIILIVTIGTFIFTSLSDDSGDGTNGEVQELEIVTYTQDDLQGENADQIPDTISNELENMNEINTLETVDNSGAIISEENDGNIDYTINDISQQAIENDNDDECLNLGGIERTLCYDNFYFNKFKETKDFSYCDQIQSSTLKSSCINWDDLKFEEAFESRDIGICQEIINEELKILCEGELSR